MANFIQKGDIIDFPNSTEEAISYGDVVVLGGHVCVAAENIKAGEVGGLRTSGVFEFNADKTAAIKFGDVVYYDKTNDCITSTKGSLTTIAGTAISEKAASTEGIVLVRILDTVITSVSAG